MYQRILVPLDGSKVAQQALPYARNLAKAMGAEVRLLEVVSPFPRELMRSATSAYADGQPAYPPSLDQWRKVQEDQRSAAQKRLETAARPLRDSGLEVSVDVLEDDASDGIARAAKQEPGTLVAISTHGRSGLGRWVLGSVTDKVVRLSEQPVLVVRALEESEREARISRVLLPLDGTEASEAALLHAVDVAKALNVGITLLRSISPLAYGDTFADYVPGLYADLAEEIDKEVKGYLDATAQRVRDRGIADVEVSAPDGYPAHVIVEEAGTAGDKLVVMATHGRSGLGRLVLGSVADRVVRHGSAPVLLVRPNET